MNIKEREPVSEEYKAGWNACVKWLNAWFCLDLAEADLGNIAMFKEAIEKSLSQSSH